MVTDDSDQDPPKPASNVVPLVPPLSRARATEIVRDAVKAGRRSIRVVGAIPSVRSRQIEQVLVDGQILEEIVEFDGREHYRFRMLRVCAGESIEIEVWLQAKVSLPWVFVTRARGDPI